ncbi:hypothetical protein TPHA_0B04700 [Tetrapisispora phaffii CBS 4417]|uniref:Phosphatidic acid phosphatase type 2/haloperoxidase domain-containing protein n=1 Tax=Tetrapisispora phaffii (strain ATCC 24235 / CBS 4417 / NBRC 1672 / NRRL Y-8282 / UCD 70-5) TaxID=1071381 RepID=G8BQ58_TETPH|nr:hypothetical protein TPHA_0B04700 [Tetrapisispora phaffii CBS 4417]CCE62139.1 hypothetical protein TPHA_0B04700 [Tetrapisispora phaffii CBS 4417]
MKLNLQQVTSYLSVFILQYLYVLIGFVFFFYSEYGLVPRTTDMKFNIKNGSIAKAHVADEVVSGVECLSIAFLLPTVVIIVHCLVGRISKKRLSVSEAGDKKGNSYMLSRLSFIPPQLHVLQLSLLCLGLILTVNGTITNILKLSIGNARPDFLDRCQPDIPAEMKDQEWFTLDICKQANHDFLYEGLKSTPSGHSSFISCSMAYLFWWQTYFLSTSKSKHFWCLLLAAVVIVSRLTDHRHHWYDLLFGTVVGLASFFFARTLIFDNKKVDQLLPTTKN